MKKIIFLLLVLGIFFHSCRKALKDPKDYYPVVKTVSAVVQLDGSVLVTGELDSPGLSKDAVIDNVGFCLSTGSDPRMHERQLIASLSGTSFSVSYPATDFSEDSIYYFRAWATNNYGYSMGGVLAVDSIIATPVTAPCTLAMNYVHIGSGPAYYYYDVNPPDSYNYFIAATLSGPTVHFTFGSALTTGIYQTTTSSSPGAGEVHVSLYQGSIYGGLNSGSNVYVNRLSPTNHEITICNAPWIYSSTTFYFNTHFITPY